MNMVAKYVHTNLIAQDWRTLAKFYQDVFGCTPILPERDLQGDAVDAGTAIVGAHIQGIHLRLPGYGDDGPTLEIFSYTPEESRIKSVVNRPGFGHIAFRVDNVNRAYEIVLAAGGQPVGEIVTLSIVNGGKVTWCYLRDPEGNIIELQSWASRE